MLSTEMASRIDALEAQMAVLIEERDAYQRLVLELLETNETLKRGILSQKRERTRDDGMQLSFALLCELLGKQSAEAAAIEQEASRRVKAHERKAPTGRQVLPEHLPRIEIEIVPEAVKQKGLEAFERIGQEVTEVLERRRSSMVVVKMVRGKYVPKHRRREEETTVLCAETPELPIERGMAGPCLLADTIVKRWQDHLPLHRQEQIYRREGVELARSTVCSWHQRLAALCAPLIASMREDALKQEVLCTDATGVLVQAKERCERHHFWVLVAPKRSVLFEFSKRHTKVAVDSFLKAYKGYLVADAHTVYDHLYVGGDVVEVGCWAHCRRYFFKALSSDPSRAHVALTLINELFRIERQHKTAPRKKRKAIRKTHSAPVVDRFYQWCDTEVHQVLDETPIQKAMRYAQNQRDALMRFLEDGALPLHNNESERQLRRQAIGRKNWLFIGSDEGAIANTTFVSLLASCQMHHIEPWSYLRDLFCLLPSWPNAKVFDLAPLNWKQTIARPEVKQKLDENIFRAATLAR